MSAYNDPETLEAIGSLISAIPDLSPRELTVCLHLLEQRSTKEIAEQLCLSSRTVENHRLSIRRKMGARADLTIELMRLRARARRAEGARMSGARR